MRLNRLAIGPGMASLVIAVAALIPSATFAQESGTAADSGPRAEREHRGFGGPRLFGGDELAEALGVTTDELRDAVTSVREALKPAERPTTRPTDEERAAHRKAFMEALAGELGVSVNALSAAQDAAEGARKAAAIERIEAKVADGTLTRERADAIIEAIENGEKPGFFDHGGPRGPRGPRGGGFLPALMGGAAA